ncbi:MFS general substrate transporter, partial [Acaromyces ingoldii]
MARSVRDEDDDEEERQALLHPTTLARRRNGWASSPPLLLVLLLTLSAGSNYAESCLGPLKSLLVSELNLTNAQYGVISSATQLSNTVVPLFCGLWIDVHGASRVARLATLSVVLGCLGSAVALEAGSYLGLVVSRMVQGLGVVAVDMAAVKLLVLWFRDAGWLGSAISIDFAFARLLGVVGKATAVPIASSWSSTPKTSRTFWVASFVASISFGASIAYLGLEDEPRYPRTSLQTQTQRHTRARTTMRSALTALRSLPAFFVVIAATQFYQPIAVFNNLSADVIRWKGQSPRQAGWTSSLGQVAPIFVAPWLGLFF